MAAPTLTATYVPASNWTVGGVVTKTTSVTVAAGDSLVLVAACEAGAVSFTASGGTGITWGTPTAVNPASHASCAMWVVGSVGSGQTFTLQVDKSGGGGSTDTWGFMLLRWAGGGVVGTPASGNGTASTPSLAVTTAAANSALACINTDWNATAGARTYRQVNGANPTEQAYFGVAGSTYIGEVFTYADAGAAGAKTVGLTAPTGENWATIAVEVQGSAGGGATVTAVVATASGSMPVPVVSGGGGSGATVTAVVMTATGVMPVPVVSGETVLSGGGPATATAAGVAPVVSAGATVTAVVAAASAGAIAPTVSAGGNVNVAAVAATGSAAALAPTVTASGAGQVNAVRAVATATALVPSGSGSATVTAVCALASVQGVAPTVAASSTLAAVKAVGSAMALVPSVFVSGNAPTITHPRAVLAAGSAGVLAANPVRAVLSAGSVATLGG